MPTLTEILLDQHRAIEVLAAAVREGLVQRNAPAVREALEHLAALLRAHFDLEEAELYPWLREPTRADGGRAARVACEFADSLGSIRRYLEQFLERHTGPELNLERVGADWPPIAATLSARITSEELSLFAGARHASGPGAASDWFR